MIHFNTLKPKRYPKVIHSLLYKTAFGLFALLILTVSLASSLSFAQSHLVFNRELVLEDDDLYSLPSPVNSVQAIQSFLASRNSVLANQTITIDLYRDITGSYPLTYNGATPTNNFQPTAGYLNQAGQTISFAEFVWRLSRTNLGSGCSEVYTSVCFDNGAKPINPGFILAKIQKESGLVNGACAAANADTNPGCYYSTLAASNPQRYSLAGRMERATGYFCFESPDKTKGCYDENPSWKIYKGVFKQTYHMLRRILLLEKYCVLGGIYSFKNSSGDHKVGNSVVKDGQSLILGNGITCALYIYTPHISDLLWRVMRGYNVLYDFRDKYNLPSDYTPKPIQSPRVQTSSGITSGLPVDNSTEDMPTEDTP